MDKLKVVVGWTCYIFAVLFAIFILSLPVISIFSPDNVAVERAITVVSVGAGLISLALGAFSLVFSQKGTKQITNTLDEIKNTAQLIRAEQDRDIRQRANHAYEFHEQAQQTDWPPDKTGEHE